MSNLTKFMAGLFAPKVVSDILDNQDPKVLGREAGASLRKMIENQVGKQSYNSMSGRITSWLDGLYVGLRKELL